MLIERGQVDEGREYFEKTLAPVDERTPQYAVDAAIASARAGRFDEAKDRARQALKRARGLGQVSIARLAEQVLGKLEKNSSASR